MNTRRLVVLLLAAGVAGLVALLVRGFMGGGTREAEARIAPHPVEITQVLVAAARIEPGQQITADQVRWAQWPSSNVDASLIQKSGTLSAAAAVEGTVARAPIVEGEPITNAKIVHSQAAGFMAATLAPGMRAVAISVSVASVAGGFILPNDRVDILLTVVTGDNPRRGTTRAVLSNVRVLAIDQASDGKSQKAVSDVKTATLEVTPQQAQMVSLAQAMGTLSLALRSLGDNETVASRAGPPHHADDGASDDSDAGLVSVIRYGMMRRQAGGGGQ